MWEIIKAEMQYYKWLFISLYMFVMPFYIINSIRGNMQKHLIFIAFYTLPIIGIFVKKSKRTRLHAGLPVSIFYLGISRYPIITVFWISLVVLFCISVILSKSATLNSWQILSITATGPFVAACMNISKDLRFSKFAVITQIVFKIIIVLFAVIIAVLYFSTYAEGIFNINLSWIFQNPLFAIIMIICTLALMVISVRLFEGRSTYVM
jgi:hypothetical protein